MLPWHHERDSVSGEARRAKARLSQVLRDLDRLRGIGNHTSGTRVNMLGNYLERGKSVTLTPPTLAVSVSRPVTPARVPPAKNSVLFVAPGDTQQWHRQPFRSSFQSPSPSVFYTSGSPQYGLGAPSTPLGGRAGRAALAAHSHHQQQDDGAVRTPRARPVSAASQLTSRSLGWTSEVPASPRACWYTGLEKRASARSPMRQQSAAVREPRLAVRSI